jgi:K+-sensing histidine kinase KdpD
VPADTTAILPAFLQKQIAGYLVSVGGVVLVALLLWPIYHHVRGVTAATALLLVVLLVALKWGTGPALVSSFLGTLYLNYFYVPQLLKLDFRLGQGEDLVGLVAFLFTSILVGHLSSQAQNRAHKIQELYDQLRFAFDQSSQLEAVKRSERLKSALLDSVTHDLRTPLTSIKAAATALMDVRQADPALAGSAESSIENLLGNIVQQSDRLNHFIEELIELAQIESGREQGNQKWELIPMEEIVGTALARAEATLKNHEVVVECEESLHVAVNSRAIAQVLFALLENASSYTLPATTVRVIAKRQGLGHIHVAVEDEGPGIPVHLREKVFEKFFRGKAPERRTMQTTGLGLGLAIARGIIEANGGKIWVESCDSGRPGARFVFMVPTRNLELERAEFDRTASQ